MINFLNQNMLLHPKYYFLQSEIKKIIANFDAVGTYVVEGGRNTIKKVKTTTIEVNIKSYKIPKWFNAIAYAYFRKSKAERSFTYASKLIDMGIRTPFPIAYIEEKNWLGLQKSFYICEHFNFDFEYREVVDTPVYENRDEIIKQFTEFSFKLHNLGINFLDHSPGNTLIKEVAPNKYEFYLIDLNRMKFEEMTIEDRMFNLRRMWMSKRMIKEIALHYATLSNEPFDKLYTLLLGYSKDFKKKKLRKKFLKKKLLGR